MADLEDSTAPTWENVVVGHVNLIDAIDRTITYDASDGKHYELDDETATLLLRPRGWHLNDKHVKVEGTEVSGGLLDFGLYFFHNAQRLLDAGSHPYFYFPKMEHHLEARLWNDVLTFAEDAMGVPARLGPRDGADRDAARRVPDGRDPLRAARPLLRAQRRPLGLHLLDDQVLPGPRGLRAAGPQRREDDRAVHEGLHGAAGQDLPRAAARSRWAAWRR